MMLDVAKVLIPSILTFAVGIAITPILTHYLYKHKMWKKSARVDASDITSEDFKKHHNTAQEISTPRLGGMIIWIATLITITLIYLLSIVYPTDLTEKLNFLSRNQTLVPLGALLFGSIIGLIDDLLNIYAFSSFGKDNIAFRWVKIFSLVLVSLLISFWFYFKLGKTVIHVPFGGGVDFGIWFIPFFIMVTLGTWSSSVIDGMDGLSGGIMSIIFTAYSAIAFFNNQIDLSVLCAVIAGGTLAFLWFNIPPARFYMSETGMMGLTVALSVVAFLTDTVAFLPIIALPLVATSASSIIQITGYKYFNKHRVFRVAPLHHHFEVIGWSREKVVMRYWIIGVVCAGLGTILAIIG